MANSTVSFILGVLTVLVIIAGVYIYIDFTKTKSTVANYSASDSKSGKEVIYDLDSKDAKDAAEKEVDNSVDSSQADQKGTISGKLCYPSDFLPKGEIVIKNTSTEAKASFPVDGTKSDFKITVDPGTYDVRYQAHATGGDEYMSGYYTKCGIDSSADVCNADDAHSLIAVSVLPQENVKDIKICDFYYQDEPDF